MVINDPAALINAVVCTVIVVVLMFYQRGDSRHRPAISLLAYIIVLVYATVLFRYLFSLYQQSHWLVVLVNVLICVLILRSRGNVARLLDVLRR